MYKRLLTILLLFSLLGFSSCGGDDNIDKTTPPQEQPSTPDGGKDDGKDDGDGDGSESVDPLPDNIEIGENTVQLSKAQKDNIESVDDGNTTLSFSLSTPEEQIPEVGQIILQLEPTESLPFGFLGRVTNVTNNGAAIVVETEAPSLSEAFDKLEFDEELKILQDPTRFSWGTDEYGYHYFTLDANANVELRPGINVSVSGDVTFSCKTTARGQFNKDVNREDLDFDIKTKVSARNLALKLSGKIDNGSNKFLKAPIGPAIPFTGLLGKLSVEAALQLYAGGQLSGEAGVQLGFSHESAKSFKIKSEQGKWVNMQPSPDDDAELSTPGGEATFSPEVSFYLDGSAMMGFFTGFELKLFGRDEYKLSLAPYAGYEISSNQNLINLADIKYEESKDVHVTGAVVAGVEASANATFFNHKVDATFFNLKWRGAEIHRYIFPSFDGSYSVNNTDRADCKVVVERDVLIPLEVGVEQYYDGYSIKRSKSLPYQLNKAFSNPFVTSFSYEKGCSYWTYVKLFNKYVKCSKLEDELRELLEKFYHDTGGDNWCQNNNWCTDAPLDKWYGVSLRSDDSGEKKLYLDLDANHLVGSGSLSGCTALEVLYCSYNQLTSLNVSGCTALESLGCECNKLTSLDVSGCTALRDLYCYTNKLTSLDVSGFTALGWLHCSTNKLTSLNVSGCTALEWLYCWDNQLTSLDVSGCTALEHLSCYENKITQVIPDFFDNLTCFKHDRRYEYYWEDGQKYHKGYGWWYPGEPQKGYHRRD